MAERKKSIVWDATKELKSGGHGGGDHALVHDFVRAVSFQKPELLSLTIQVSMASHLMGFKAVDSRLMGRVEMIGI